MALLFIIEYGLQILLLITHIGKYYTIVPMCVIVA